MWPRVNGMRSWSELELLKSSHPTDLDCEVESVKEMNDRCDGDEGDEVCEKMYQSQPCSWVLHDTKLMILIEEHGFKQSL